MSWNEGFKCCPDISSPAPELSAVLFRYFAHSALPTQRFASLDTPALCGSGLALEGGEAEQCIQPITCEATW